MSLETATYIGDLNASNPTGTDDRSQGDDHLRLIKSVLQNTLPDASHVIRYPGARTITGAYSVPLTDDKQTIFVTTAAAPFNITLPSSLGIWEGWSVRIVKFTNDALAAYVVPPSGTLANGAASCRVGQRYVTHEFIWTGSEYLRVVAPGEVKPGVLESYYGGTLPNDYALAYGQSLLRTDYPELYAAWGVLYGAADGSHFNAPDVRGVAEFALDNMGGSAASRLTTVSGGTTLGARGGTQTHALVAAELPATPPAGTITMASHVHSVQHETALVQAGAGANVVTAINFGANNADTEGTVATGTFTGANLGSGTAHNNLPPLMLVNKMFRLC